MKWMQKNLVKYIMYVLTGIAILFLYYKLDSSEFLSVLFIIIILLPATERGITFYRNIFSKKAALKFLGIILTLDLLVSLECGESGKLFFIKSVLLVLILCFSFILLQFKNDRIKSTVPTWRDFLTILFIFVIPNISFLFIFPFLAMPYVTCISSTNFLYLFLTLLYLILFLVVRNFSREDIGYKLKIDVKDVAYTFFGFLLILILNSILDVGIRSMFSRNFFGYLYIGLRTKLSDLLSSPFSSYIHYIFIVGLGEELESRGFLLGFIKKRLEGKWYGTAVALLISSLLFGFNHSCTNLYGKLQFSLIGLVLGIIFIRTKKLTAPILLHALINIR